MTERDPNYTDDAWIEDVRRAWRGLEPRPPAADLELEDAETRASVEWMRAAWSSLEVPEPRLPRVASTPSAASPAAATPGRAGAFCG